MCPVRCPAASPDSSHQKPVPPLQVVPTQSVSRHCQMSSGSRQGKTALVENHCLKCYVSGETREQDSQSVSLDVGFRVVGLVTGNLSRRTEAGVPDGDPFPDKKTSPGHGFLGLLHPPFPLPLPTFIPSQLTAQKLQGWGLAHMVVPTPLWAASGPRG